MSNITSARQKIQQEATQWRSAVGESQQTIIGGSINYLIDERDTLRANIDSNDSEIADHESRITTIEGDIGFTPVRQNYSVSGTTGGGGANQITLANPIVATSSPIIINLYEFSFDTTGASSSTVYIRRDSTNLYKVIVTIAGNVYTSQLDVDEGPGGSGVSIVSPITFIDLTPGTGSVTYSIYSSTTFMSNAYAFKTQLCQIF